MPSLPPQPPPGRSFYDPRSNARPFLARSVNSENRENQGATLTAWQLVAQACFPDTEPDHNEFKIATWTVVHVTDLPEESSREDAGTINHKRETLRVRLHVANQKDLGVEEHDIVTIECESPSQNSTEGWQRLLKGSIERLLRCFPTTKQTLITAVGCNFLVWQWDPDHLKKISIVCGTNRNYSGEDTARVGVLTHLQPLSVTHTFLNKFYGVQDDGPGADAVDNDFQKTPTILVEEGKSKKNAVALESLLLQVRTEAIVEHGVLSPSQLDIKEPDRAG